MNKREGKCGCECLEEWKRGERGNRINRRLDK